MTKAEKPAAATVEDVLANMTPGERYTLHDIARWLKVTVPNAQVLMTYLIERLDTADVGLDSLRESIDTAPIGGRLVFHLRWVIDAATRRRCLVRSRRFNVCAVAPADGRRWPRVCENANDSPKLNQRIQTG